MYASGTQAKMKIALVCLCNMLICIVSTRSKLLAPHAANAPLKSYLENVLERNQCRSLVLYIKTNDFANEVVSFMHKLHIPVYSISNVRLFNGKRHWIYYPENAFEESKIYIIAINSTSEFDETIDRIRRLYFWRQRDRTIILVTSEYTNETLINCFNYLWWREITNIAVVFINETMQTFTYSPFPQVQIKKIKGANLFEEKYTNLMGHWINISMFANVLDAIPEANAYKGKDGRLAETFMEFLNASYTFVQPRDSVDYGENLNRTKFTGVFADMVTNRTQVALNSRYYKDEFQDLLEASYPHGRDDLTCLVPVRRNDDVKQFLQNFSTSTWILLAVITVLFFITVLLISVVTNKKIHIKDIALSVIAIIVGQQIKYFYNIKILKAAVIIYVVITFFFNSAYQSQMTSLFTVPRKPHQIDTLDELALADMKIYTLFRFKRMLGRNLRSNLHRRILPRLVAMQENEQISEINEHKNTAVICKDHIATYAVAQKENLVDGEPFYRIMSERPMPSIVCYVVRYGSPLLTRLNSVVSRLTEAGIMDHWRKQTVDGMAIKRNAEYSRQKNLSKKENMLTMTNLNNLFWFLVGGWVLSAVVWVFEIVYHNKHGPFVDY